MFEELFFQTYHFKLQHTTLLLKLDINKVKHGILYGFGLSPLKSLEVS